MTTNNIGFISTPFTNNSKYHLINVAIVNTQSAVDIYLDKWSYNSIDQAINMLVTSSTGSPVANTAITFAITYAIDITLQPPI